MTMYVAFPPSSHAINLKSIRSGTVKSYLSITTIYPTKVDLIPNYKLCKLNNIGGNIEPINNVTKEIEQYQTVLNCLEPWTMQ